MYITYNEVVVVFFASCPGLALGFKATVVRKYNLYFFCRCRFLDVNVYNR